MLTTRYDVAGLTELLYAAIACHAQAAFPGECCGVVLHAREEPAPVYLPLRNLHSRPGEHFRLDPEGYAAAADAGEILAIVHSHPNASANPSLADRAGCEHSGVPWIVIGWPSGVCKTITPEGWSAPYKGRPFVHGVHDCYSLVQDWYRRELRIELPDFDREDDWWRRGEDLYMRHYAEAGFAPVTDGPRRHDGILMQVLSDTANHAAVYLGNGAILHHLHGRLSCEDVYGGYWLRHTLAVLRHESLR